MTVSHDKLVKVWSAKSQECLDTKRGHVGVVRVCAISPDGFQAPSRIPHQFTHPFAMMPFDQIASCGTNIKLWSTNSPGSAVGTLKDHVGAVNAVAFNPDGNLIASGGDDLIVRVWEAMVGDEAPPETPFKKLLAHKTPVLAVGFSPNGHGLASCAASGNVRLWNWADEVLLPGLTR